VASTRHGGKNSIDGVVTIRLLSLAQALGPRAGSDGLFILWRASFSTGESAMLFLPLMQRRSSKRRPKRQRRNGAAVTLRPVVEVLEGRCLLSAQLAFKLQRLGL
jgi:hypothetical protein